MTAAKRALITAGGGALWLLVFGFVMFAVAVMRKPPSDVVKADGIVVLTGGETRIAEGARLLKEGRAGRLLISGVNRIARPEELRRITGLSDQDFRCCVDLGYKALNTAGNADETNAWARAHNYDSLIVVTASYHMPRSLAELARTMPGVKLHPHPVMPKSFPDRAWWLHHATTRTLVSEYLKYLPSALKLALSRILRSGETEAVASRPTTRAGM